MANEILEEITRQIRERHTSKLLDLLTDSAYENSFPPAHRAALDKDVFTRDFVEHRRIASMPIHTTTYMPSHKPRVELSTKIDVSEEFRARFDEWLREYFGEESYMLVAEVPAAFNLTGRSGGRAIFCHPSVAREIRRMRDAGTGVFA